MSRARMGRLLFGLWLLAGCAERAAAQDGVAPFYKGKTITIVVASSPGGGYDLYGRMIARHIGKHIPGNPTILPQNMAGAGSLRAANFIYTAAPKEGETFTPNQSLLGKEFVGLVAQDVEGVMPEMITQTTGWVDGVEVNDLRMYDSTALTYALINAVKELSAANDALTARVAALEGAP